MRMRRYAAIAIGLLGFVPGAARATSPAAAFDAADIAALRTVLTPRIAPDGRHVVYAVGTPDDPQSPARSRLWVVEPRHPDLTHLLPGSEPGDREPRWSPDGNSLAFLGKRGSAGRTEVWLASPWEAPAHPLDQFPGDAQSFRWSPDGREIAAIVHEATGPAHTPRGAVIEDRASTSDRLYVAGLDAHAASAVTPPQHFVFDATWAPDGQHLAIRFGDGGGLDYFWYKSRVAIIDRDGRQQALLPHLATALTPRVSPDGRSVVYGYFNQDGITGDAGRYDLADGHLQPLGQDWSGSLRDLQWDDDGRGLAGLGLDGVSPRLVHVDAQDGDVSPVATLGGDPYEFSRARDGAIALAASSRTAPDEVWLYRAGHGVALTETNPGVRRWALGGQRVVSWRSSRDGTTLQGVLVLPPGAGTAPHLPLLVQIHGGPYDAWTDGWLASWHNWARLLAAHGYAVLMPNPRGSDGRGAAFATATRHDWGGLDYQDIIDGVDALSRAGVADPKRLAIGGWSYGGFMSAWAAGHNTRFRTAIVGAEISDLATMAITTDVGQSFIVPYFGDPLRGSALYAAHSPANFARDVHVPVLIMHGDADARVPPAQSKLFYLALRDAGSNVQLVRYPGAPHWFGGTVGMDYEIDVQQRVLDWLDRHLSP